MHHKYSESWYYFRANRAVARPWLVTWKVRNAAGRNVTLRQRFETEADARPFARKKAGAKVEHAPDSSRRPRPHQINWFEADAQGRRVRRTEHFPSKSLAMAFKREIDKRLNAPLYPASTEKTWHEALAEWHVSIAASSRGNRYYADRALGSFTQWIRPAFLSSVTPAHVADYLAALRLGRILLPERRTRSGRVVAGQRPRSGSDAAVAQDYAALHHFFATFVARGELLRHPMDSIRKPRAQKHMNLPPQPADWVALLERLPACEVQDVQGWHLLILLAVVTGMDQADLLRITLQPVAPPRWEPFRFALGSADTDHIALLASRRTKTRGLHLFGLPRVVSDRLALRVSELEPGTEYLFPWRLFPRKQWNKIRRVAPFRFTFQSLRSAAATQAIEAAAVAAGQELLGHQSDRTTRLHYANAQRTALAVARRLQLPDLPEFPRYVAAAPPAKPPRRPSDT